MITGPQQMAALGEAPLDVERANWRTLDSRMMSAINTPGTAGQVPGVGRVRLRERRHLRREPVRQRRSQHGRGRRRHARDRQHARRHPVRVHRVQGQLRQRRRRLQAARADDDGVRRLRRGPVVRGRDARPRIARLQHEPQHRRSAPRRAPRPARRRGYHIVARAARRLLVQVRATGTMARSPS